MKSLTDIVVFQNVQHAVYHNTVLTSVSELADTLGANARSDKFLNIVRFLGGFIRFGFVTGQADFGSNQNFLTINFLDLAHRSDGGGTGTKILVESLAHGVVLQKIQGIAGFESILAGIRLLEFALGTAAGAAQGNFG